MFFGVRNSILMSHFMNTYLFMRYLYVAWWNLSILEVMKNKTQSNNFYKVNEYFVVSKVFRGNINMYQSSKIISRHMFCNQSIHLNDKIESLVILISFERVASFINIISTCDKWFLIVLLWYKHHIRINKISYVCQNLIFHGISFSTGVEKYCLRTN